MKNYLIIRNYRILILLILGLNSYSSTAQIQNIDHWETVVYETDIWHYLLGYSAPPTNWKDSTFSPVTWQSGAGGIGYSDGDDNTLISSVVSLYMRLDFDIIDSTAIEAALLHADYDDAFVAYLNGHEIARSNIGTAGIEPLFSEAATTFKEAVMYQGENPSAYLFLKNDLNQYLQQGTNTLAIQVHNYSFTSSDLSSRFFFSVGLSDTATVYNPVPSWFTTPFIATHLPLVKINTNGVTIPEETKIMASMQIIDNGVGNLNHFDDLPNGYDNQIGIELRGASSLSFPKNGYGLETRDSSGANNNVSLLGMPSENDWVLHGPYSDKTLLRNVLAYHIGGQLGRYNPRVRLCEVILNNQYWGVYVLKEKIKRDKNRVDIAKLSPTDTLGDDLTGGYIFKIDRDMGTENGWLSPYGYGYYAYHHPNPDNLHPLQKTYIQNHFNAFESMMVSTNYNNPVSGYRTWIDVPSFIDYMLIQEVTRNIDAYRLSAFMYKEKDSDGGLIHAGPIWDYNLGFGNEDFCDNGNYDEWAFDYRYVCGSPFPVWWGSLVNDSDFRDDFHCRWNELRSTVLNTDTVLNYIDSMVVLLGDATTRNFEKWNVIGQDIWPNAYVGQTYDEEIVYLKNWVTQRFNWIDANMIGSAANCITSSHEPLANKSKIYPNPFRDYLTFETSTKQSIQIQLYNVLGQNIETIRLDGIDSYYKMNTNHLPSGMYFYSIFEKNELISSGKVLKE